MLVAAEFRQIEQPALEQRRGSRGRIGIALGFLQLRSP